MRHISFSLLIFIIFQSFLLTGCPGRGEDPPSTNGDDGQDTEVLGRYLFDDPVPFTETGTLDTPRLVADNTLNNVHLSFLKHDGTSQRIMYTRIEDGEFRSPSYLSEREGQKRGGGYLSMINTENIIFYWVNVTATGGVLRYKETDNSGRTFNMEARWNERNEARWPCVMRISRDTVAYFFIHYGNDWELVMNRNFSDDDEPTIGTPRGTPFRLQGVTDGNDKVWLAYFERTENSGGGRISFMKSSDEGHNFLTRYLFNDLIIQNLTSFFRMARTSQGRDNYIHLIYTEETPELTTIYYASSEDDGESFSTPVAILSSELPLTRAPVLLAHDQYVMIATADADDEGPALRYLLSEDFGENFGPAAVATRSVASPETISGVMGGDGSVILVWDDLAQTSEIGEQIYRLSGTLRGR